METAQSPPLSQPPNIFRRCVQNSISLAFQHCATSTGLDYDSKYFAFQFSIRGWHGLYKSRRPRPLRQNYGLLFPRKMAFAALKISPMFCWLLLIQISAAFTLHSSPPPHSPDTLVSRAENKTPSIGKDGLCASYVIQGGDTCASIAQQFGITTADIEQFNSKTYRYAWSGCDRIKQGNFICISSGEPPMPFAFAGAQCGPQVPGTVRPSDMSVLDSLNPCASNKCVSTVPPICFLCSSLMTRSVIYQRRYAWIPAPRQRLRFKKQQRQARLPPHRREPHRRERRPKS